MARRDRHERPGLREQLDRWHGTVVRYCGVGLLFFAIGSGQWRDNSALIPASVGMIFYKNVVGR